MVNNTKADLKWSAVLLKEIVGRRYYNGLGPQVYPEAFATLMTENEAQFTLCVLSWACPRCLPLKHDQQPRKPCFCPFFAASLSVRPAITLFLAKSIRCNKIQLSGEPTTDSTVVFLALFCFNDSFVLTIFSDAFPSLWVRRLLFLCVFQIGASDIVCDHLHGKSLATVLVTHSRITV